MKTQSDVLSLTLQRTCKFYKIRRFFIIISSQENLINKTIPKHEDNDKCQPKSIRNL